MKLLRDLDAKPGPREIGLVWRRSSQRPADMEALAEAIIASRQTASAPRPTNQLSGNARL